MLISRISRFPDEEERVQENTQLVVELAIQDEVFSDEETFSVHNALFDKSSKKLIFERTSKNKKGKSHSTIDLRDIPHLNYLQFTKLQEMH
jgi:hypothetical protein